MSEAWPSVFRIVVGIYWLYFASQKWQGVGWMHSLMVETAKANPIPGLHELLTSVIVPNWLLFALAQGVGGPVGGVLLFPCLAARWPVLLGLLVAVHLPPTVGF